VDSLFTWGMEGEIAFEDGTYFSSPLLYFSRVVLSMNPSTHRHASCFAVNADTQVHTEFSRMFQLKITVFFTELLSVILTPWILFFSLPPCSATIVDFFREFTVHVDGIGYVCSFAVFDFQLHNNIGKDAVDAKANADVPAGNTGARKRQKAQNNSSGQKDYKMEKSFLHFKATHPDWQPDLNGSIFLDKVSKRTSTLAPTRKWKNGLIPTIELARPDLTPNTTGTGHGERWLRCWRMRKKRRMDGIIVQVLAVKKKGS